MMLQNSRERLVNAATFGAWLLKCDPKVWDIGAFLDDGGDHISGWSVAPNYRSRFMRRGQKAVFWVSGQEGQYVRPGLWGIGWLTGPAEWAVSEIKWDEGDDPDDRAKHGYWLDRERALAAEHFVSTDIPLWVDPYSKVFLRRRRIIKDAEVFRSPQMSNPSFLNRIELDALRKIVGPWPRMPRGLAEPAGAHEIEITEPDEVTADVLQQEALNLTVRYFEDRRYSVSILVENSPGWDIEARKGTVVRRIRVRGAAVDDPVLFLSEKDVEIARRDDEWELSVVSGILSGRPNVLLCPALWVCRASQAVQVPEGTGGAARFRADFSVRPASVHGD